MWIGFLKMDLEEAPWSYVLQPFSEVLGIAVFTAVNLGDYKVLLDTIAWIIISATFYLWYSFPTPK